MPLTITFNGTTSSSLGIDIMERPAMVLPARKRETLDNIHLNGEIEFDFDTYEPFDMEVVCSRRGTDYITGTNAIIAWLKSAEADLIISDEPDKKYRAKVVNKIDFNQVLENFCEFVIVFRCRPLKYDLGTVSYLPNRIALLGAVEGIQTHTVEIDNPTQNGCKPTIKVVPSELEVVLELNGQHSIRFELETLDAFIVDCEHYRCYPEEFTNISYTKYMFGEFFELTAGENTIRANGCNIEVFCDWNWI